MSRLWYRVFRLLMVSLVVAESCGRDEPPPDPGPTITLDSATYTLRRVGDAMNIRGTINLPPAPEGGTTVAVPTFRSSDTNIVQVDNDGNIVAVGDGVARVWVTLDDDSTSAVVVVEEPLPFIALGTRAMHFNAVLETQEITVDQGMEFLIDGIPTHCTSADPEVATVSDGGRVVARGNGTTRVYCEVDVALDSIDVTVEQVAARISIVESALRPIRVVFDSLELVLARVDGGGAPMPDAQPRWTTLDPDIVRTTEDGRAVGLASGIGRIVGTLDGLADTAFVSIVSGESVTGLQARSLGVDEASRQAVALPEVPEIPPEVIAAIETAAADSARADSLFEAVVQPRDVQQMAADTVVQRDGLIVTAVAGQAEHRVNLGFGLERVAGQVFGGEVEGFISDRFGLRGGVLAGNLTASTVATQDRTMTHVFIESNVAASPWLDFHLGGSIRSYTASFGTQRWNTLYTGGRARFSFVGGALESEFRFSLMPLVSISQGVSSPSLGMTGATGLRYTAGKFTAGADYTIERYDFPAVGATTRQEQFAVLRILIGISLPR